MIAEDRCPGHATLDDGSEGSLQRRLDAHPSQIWTKNIITCEDHEVGVFRVEHRVKKRRRVEDEIAELKKKQLQKERDLQFVIDEMALLDADSSVLTAAPLPFAACANVMSRVSAAARAARQRVAERERAQDQAAEPEVENLQAAECGCFRMSMEV